MKQKLSIGEILNLLPHRYPFLLVDKILEQEENKGKIPLVAGIDKARFKKPVYHGDRLIIKVEILKMVRGIGKAKAEAYVDDNLAASAELLFTAV